MTNWRTVVRDVVVIRILHDLSMQAFLAGAARDGWLSMAQVGLLGIVLLVLCFTLSGYMSKGNRFRHLALVAFGYLLTGAYILIYPAVTLSSWLISELIGIAFSAAAGGIFICILYCRDRVESHR